MKFLLDTNVISELSKGKRCHPGVARWFASVNENNVYMSVMVLGEIHKGIEKIQASQPTRAAEVAAWMEKLILHYNERILPVTLNVALVWGRMNALAQTPAVDSLMAATAQVHGLVMVTRNTADMAPTGITLHNPFLDVPQIPTR